MASRRSFGLGHSLDFVESGGFQDYDGFGPARPGDGGLSSPGHDAAHYSLSDVGLGRVLSLGHYSEEFLGALYFPIVNRRSRNSRVSVTEREYGTEVIGTNDVPSHYVSHVELVCRGQLPLFR